MNFKFAMILVGVSVIQYVVDCLLGKLLKGFVSGVIRSLLLPDLETSVFVLWAVGTIGRTLINNGLRVRNAENSLRRNIMGKIKRPVFVQANATDDGDHDGFGENGYLGGEEGLLSNIVFIAIRNFLLILAISVNFAPGSAQAKPAALIMIGPAAEKDIAGEHFGLKFSKEMGIVAQSAAVVNDCISIISVLTGIVLTEQKRIGKSISLPSVVPAILLLRISDCDSLRYFIPNCHYLWGRYHLERRRILAQRLEHHSLCGTPCA